jgi:PAS domain S-box-containing protein
VRDDGNQANPGGADVLSATGGQAYAVPMLSLRHHATAPAHPLVMKTSRIIGDASCFRAVADAVTDCAIYLVDPDGIVISWNAGAERIKGYAAGEIVRRHFSHLYTEEDRRAEKPDEVLRAADRSGRFEDEVWQVRKSGDRFRALVVVDAIRDHDGGLVGFAKLTRDLTERTLADEALLRGEERFGRVVEATPNAIVMVDRERRIAMANAQTERVFGYSRNELLGQPAELLMPERFRSHHPQLRAAFFGNPQTRRMGGGAISMA